MSNNGFYEDTFVTTTDQVKQQNNRFTLSKVEADLFNEDKFMVNVIFHVKRELSSNEERWKILKKMPSKKDEVIFLIEAKKLSKKEREFLRKPEGVLFLINQAKFGIKSLNSLRNNIKLLL
jgi:hypothetical protein